MCLLHVRYASSLPPLSPGAGERVGGKGVSSCSPLTPERREKNEEPHNRGMSRSCQVLLLHWTKSIRTHAPALCPTRERRQPTGMFRGAGQVAQGRQECPSWKSRGSSSTTAAVARSWTASALTSSRARSLACSDPTAPARQQVSAWPPASSRPT